MKPVSYKLKTGRRFRGLEVAQAALLLVLGVVVALALYFLTMGMVASTPTPDVELDPYNSYIVGSTANVALRFGKSGMVQDVNILGNDGNPITGSCTFPGGAKPPMPVNAGQEYIFTCKLADGKTWQSNMIVQVTFADGSIAYVRWVTR
jgi:hypothetical protein